MTAPMIQLLVLDGQGVVFTDPFHDFLDRLADATDQARATVRNRWANELRDRAWRGTINDNDLWHELSAGSGTEWDARLEAAYEAGPAAPHLRAWAAVVPIWLLTNHRTPWIERRIDRLDLRPWLSRVLVSDALGAVKPEPAVFAPILAHVTDPQSILLVDDQAKNVAAAAAAGMSSLLADPAGTWLGAVHKRLPPGRLPQSRSAD